MKSGMKNFIIVACCIIVIVLFAVFSINRRNNAEIESQRIENIISGIETNDDVIDTVSDLAYNGTYFILYDGYEIKIKTGEQALVDMENSEGNNEKYNIKYYCYENGKSQEEKGEFGEETYEGVFIVQNVDKIAISEKYDAIPRKYKELKKLPEDMNLKLDYTDIEIVEVDLDGDETKEYLICYEIEDKENDIAKSSIELYDSNYQKVATLMSLDTTYDDAEYLNLDDAEYIDIDNDGVMEIILNKPVYEGTSICIYKYVNGNIYGETDVKATLNP